MRFAYEPKRFRPGTVAIIEEADAILTDLAAEGYAVTLRALYYQFITRNRLPNTESSYKRLGSIVNDARLSGLLDWEHITDRTRSLRSVSHWESPEEIIQAVAPGFALDSWEGQPCRPEVWIEKDALLGVIERTCTRLDVPFFSCRGYVSQSEMWGAAQRLESYIRNGQRPVVLHLGDHDPSGIDMTRDIADRLTMFVGEPVEVRRLALNWDQVEKFKPPPNPTKVTDSRARSYIRTYGKECWELDALPPQVISRLIEDAVTSVVDAETRNVVIARQEKERAFLESVAKNWHEVTRFITKSSA